MLCQKCQKNPANVQMEQVINGVKSTHFLCQDCAGMMSAVSLDDVVKGLLSSLINLNVNPAAGAVSPGALFATKCSFCGLRFDQFTDSGKFGCGHCYGSFRNEIQSVLKNMSGTSRHTGKIPHKSGVELKMKRDLENLRGLLKSAVESEEFEEAAKIRDRIKDMEKNGGGQNG